MWGLTLKFGLAGQETHMAITSLLRHHSAPLFFGCLLMLGTTPAFAAIDTFTIQHVSGACSDRKFGTIHFLWNGRHRIPIASGERISIILYGHFADWATNATGSDIHEWIENKGTTDKYPGYNGNKKGYVNIHVRAASEHGTGNRTVKVHWQTGTETINLRIVANCAALDNAAYRMPASTPSQTTPTNPPPLDRPRIIVGNSLPNLLPAVQTPYILARALGPVVATLNGGMWPVNSVFCNNLPQNAVTTVPVPPLTWGVSGANVTATTGAFSVQLFNDANPAAPVPIDTMTLAGGLAPTQPLVQRTNYPGRPAMLSVIRDPRFVISSSTTQTIEGCFTAPGITQPMEPALKIVVDTTNAVNEGMFENDNELRLQ